MKRIIFILLFAAMHCYAADYISSGIGLGLRATQMIFSEKRASKKDKREAELHRRKMEKEYLERSGLKELDKILRFRYRINLMDVENHPQFWQYAEKTPVRKGVYADTVIMQHIEKKEFAKAAAAINTVVNRLKKERKWKPPYRQK